MTILLLYPFFFLIWFVYSIKRNGLTAFSIIISLYLISSISAVVLFYVYNETFVDNSVAILPVSVHILVLFVCFQSLEKSSLVLIREPISSPSVESLKKFSVFLVIINIPFEIISLYEIRDNLFLYWGDLGLMRQSFYTKELVYTGGFNISYVISATSLFAVGTFFELLKHKGLGLLKILVFVVSLHIAIQNLKYMSRDGVFILIIIYLCSFFIYKNKLPAQTVRIVRVFGVLFLSIALVIFMAITVSRSEINTGAMKDPLYFFMGYLGQPFLNFSKLYVEDFILNIKYMERNVFSTFIYRFVLNYGIVLTIGFSLLFSLIMNYFKKLKKGFVYTNLMILLYYFFGFGVLYMHFYFRSRTTLLPMGICFLIIFVLNKIYPPKHIIDQQN